MILNTEQWTLVIGGIVALFTAGGYFIRSVAKARYLDAETRKLEADARARVAVIEAEREHEEVKTDSELTRKITDEVLKRGSENSDLNRLLRECEVRSKEHEGTIRELRKMVVDLGEKNAIQSDMMRQLALEHNRTKQLVEVQQTKIQTLEYKLVYKIDTEHPLDNFLEDKDKDNDTR